VSSTSTKAYGPGPPGLDVATGAAMDRPVSLARASRNLEATASSWRMWPKVNARRKDPNVKGA
jgi:hypothetical protein